MLRCCYTYFNVSTNHHNTGSVAGKDVVQLYVSLPYTDYDKEHGVEKAAIQLLDYGKTAELAPGASESVTITADMQNMASYEVVVECFVLATTASNQKLQKHCYKLVSKATGKQNYIFFYSGNESEEKLQRF